MSNEIKLDLRATNAEQDRRAAEAEQDRRRTSRPLWQESTCQQCVFWIRPEGAPHGQCRRRPPTPSAIPLHRQEQGGIVIGGQEHKQVQVKVQVMINYPLCAPENPACGDFMPAATFDKVVQDALAANRQPELR